MKIALATTVALIALISATPAGAQTAGQAETAAESAALIRRVAELELALSEIKAELARRPAGVQDTAAAPATTATLSASTAQPAAQPNDAVSSNRDPEPDNRADNEVQKLGPLEFRGYGAMSFGRPVFSNLPPTGLAGSPQSFSIGDFDLFVNAQLNDHVRIISELLITSDYTNLFSVELDRMMLDYRVNRHLSLSAGKFNTAIGFYSNEFHRAPFFQTATDRPVMFADEDANGILPVHSIGVSATGEVPSGALGLHWVAEVSNGRATDSGSLRATQNFVDANGGKAINGALYIKPAWLEGFQSGVGLYRDRLTLPGLGQIEERIYSAHAALIRSHLELMAEAAMLWNQSEFSHRITRPVTSYGQASYLFGSVRPYLRFDYQNVAASDPLFGSLGRKSGPSAGIRYDFADFVALKFQYGYLTDTARRVSTNDLQAQLAFAF
jgi:hypothetical protein